MTKDYVELHAEALAKIDTLEQQLQAAQEDLGPWTAKTLRQYVADTSDGFECLPNCDSFGHEEFCPVSNVVAAWRQLRERLAEAETVLRLYADKTTLHSIRGGGYAVFNSPGPEPAKQYFAKHENPEGRQS